MPFDVIGFDADDTLWHSEDTDYQGRSHSPEFQGCKERVEPQRFCMVGNSVRSDILPVLELGGSAAHVPYPLLWDLEQAPLDHGKTFAELASLGDLATRLQTTK